MFLLIQAKNSKPFELYEVQRFNETSNQTYFVNETRLFDSNVTVLLQWGISRNVTVPGKTYIFTDNDTLTVLDEIPDQTVIRDHESKQFITEGLAANASSTTNNNLVREM